MISPPHLISSYAPWIQRVQPGSCWAPPSIPEPASWYVLGMDRQLFGPYTITTLHEHHSCGYLHAHTLVWAAGCSDWQPLSSVLGYSNGYENLSDMSDLRSIVDRMSSNLESLTSLFKNLQEQQSNGSSDLSKPELQIDIVVNHNDAVEVKPEAISDAPPHEEGVIAPMAYALQSDCTAEELTMKAGKVEDKSAARGVLVSGNTATILTVDCVMITPLKEFTIKHNGPVHPESQFGSVVPNGCSDGCIGQDGSVLWFAKVRTVRGVFDPGGDLPP